MQVLSDAIGRERLHFEGFTRDMTLRKAVGLTKVSRGSAPTPCPSPRAASRGRTGGSGNPGGGIAPCLDR